MDRCFRIFNHLTDPSRRSPLCLKFSLLAIHLVYAGVLFLFDGDLIEKTKKEPWHTALYLLLFIVTLIQYLATAISSPGYVLDAMMAVNKRNVMYTKTPETSKQPALSRNGSVIVAIEANQTGRNIPGSNATSWSKLVTELYPLGSTIITGTCTYCNVEQPPRAKHCHVCGKVSTVHPDWRLVYFIPEGSPYLCAKAYPLKWQDVIMILLLITLSISLIGLLLLLLYHSYLILTNQTSYELVRRSRIHYLRGIPERVHPFSKGVCGNVYNFCCASMYGLKPIATPQDIEEKSRPYTCWDVATCRCY